MGYKILVSMNIAIIGDSSVAQMYAAGFAMAGHSVYMAWKEGKRTQLSDSLSQIENIEMCSIAYAAEIADLVIIATPPEEVREVSYWLGDVRKKVIVDATSNVLTDEPVKTICAIKAITGSQHIVKVFNTIGYQQLLKPLFNSDKARLILVGDSKKAKEIAKILAKELDIKCCSDFGGSETVLLFNEMTRCWKNMAGKEIQYRLLDSSKS
jgi:predicted dinucleotide-binding enzyme